MPICRTCRGEYDSIVSSRAPSGASEDGTGAPSANKPRLCPRCGSDVSAWQQFEISLPDFVIQEGGILAMLPAAAAVAVWLLWIPRDQAGNYFPILTFVCLGLCALLFFLIYASRILWWEHWWAGQIYNVTRISITSLIAVTAIGGILLSPLWVLFYTTLGRPVEFTAKVIFALIYVSAFVCLTVAATLGVVLEYVLRLERVAPPPIFVSTERLSRVVADAAIQSINLTQPGMRASSVLDDSKPVYEVLEALRIPENGGIHVLLRECKLVPYPDAEGQMQNKWMEMLWRIKADRWGHIKSVQPGTLEPFGEVKRVFREYGRYS